MVHLCVIISIIYNMIPYYRQYVKMCTKKLQYSIFFENLLKYASEYVIIYLLKMNRKTC